MRHRYSQSACCFSPGDGGVEAFRSPPVGSFPSDEAASAAASLGVMTPQIQPVLIPAALISLAKIRKKHDRPGDLIVRDKKSGRGFLGSTLVSVHRRVPTAVPFKIHGEKNR